MLLGLKRRMISRFLQSSKSKLTEKQNIQEIQRCLEDGISFCRVTDKTPCKGKVLKFNFVNYPTQYDFFQRVTSNNKVSKSSNTIFFHEDPNALAEVVLTDIHEQAENYGKIQAMEFNKYYNGDSLVDIPKNENVVVRLSDHYIYNPLHVERLRTIMYGRFITNITKLFNKNVTFINHLDDWLVMMESMVDKLRYVSKMEVRKRAGESDEYFTKINSNWVKRISELMEFVKSVEDGWFKAQAETIWSHLFTFMKKVEQGDEKALEIWHKCRNVCINEREKKYQRLGIKFDVTSARSHYTEHKKQIISLAKEKNILGIIPSTGVEYINKPCHINSLIYYTIYDIRDVAAIIDTFDKFSPDRLICVNWVMGPIRDHPENLKTVVKELGSDQPGRFEFLGLEFSTESPYVYPSMNDILDELMFSKTAIMLKHKLGEHCESLSDVSDKLRISQFAMQNFKRMRSESFLSRIKPEETQKAFNHRDGATLQYTHARLCRLITLYSDDYSFESVDFNLLSEDCAIRLVQHLARYQEVLIQCYMELEAHHLVDYLITLLKLEHLAYEELLVFNQPKRIRDARLTLFKCTRQVLANGMNILGIQPLGKI